MPQQVVPLDGKLHAVDGVPGWVVGRGFLAAGDDFETGTMTLKEAMATCEKCNAPAFTFHKGEVAPAGKVGVWIKGKEKKFCKNKNWVTYCYSGAVGKEVKRPSGRAFKLGKEVVVYKDGRAKTCLSRLQKEDPLPVTKAGWGYVQDVGADIRCELEKAGDDFIDPEFPPEQSSIGGDEDGFEWKRVSELLGEPCGVSLHADTKVTLKMRNDCAVAVSLWWIDYSGREKQYGNLRAGSSKEMTTFAT